MVTRTRVRIGPSRTDGAVAVVKFRPGCGNACCRLWGAAFEVYKHFESVKHDNTGVKLKTNKNYKANIITERPTAGGVEASDDIRPVSIRHKLIGASVNTIAVLGTQLTGCETTTCKDPARA
jgi:hypothetical protein